MTPEILVVGSLHVDVIVRAPRLPMLDETLMGQSVAYEFGGKGGNQAVAAARMGATVAIVGRVGNDNFGTAALAALDLAGVDRTQVLSGTGATGMSVAIVDDGGNYGAVVVSGVNRDIAAETVQPHPAVRVLLLQNEVPETVNLAAAARAGPDTILVLNAAPVREVSVMLLRRVDVLVVNRIEAAAMTGQAVAALDPDAAAEQLRQLGPRSVIVTLGADGAICRDADDLRHAAAGHAVAVVSTHGAGDAFVGALAVALSDGAGIEPAIVFAQGAAALHVATPVADRATITRQKVEAFLARSAI